MKARRLRLEHALLAGVALLLGGMILFASLWMHYSRISESDLNYLRHSHEVIRKMGAFRVSLLELELSERDYLITGRDRFLASNARARQALWQQHGTLSEMVANDPGQASKVAALKPVLDARMALGDQLIKLRDNYGLGGAQPLIIRGMDQVHSERIDDILDLMLDEEYRLLSVRRDKFNNSRQVQRYLAVVGGVIILLLLSVLTWWVRRELHRRRQHVSQLNRVAHVDLLTGLPNRRQFMLSSSTMLALTQRKQGMMAVMMLDLDGFKTVNDTWGHDVGDHLLVEAGRRLQSNIRASDLVARFGGDEFAIVMSELTDIEDSRRLAQKLIDVIQEPYVLGAERCDSVGVSIGIAWYPDHGADVPTLLQHADEALYESKRAGKRRYTIYTAKNRQLEQT